MIITLFILFFSHYTFALSEEEITQNVLTNFALIQEAELKNEASKNEVISSEGAFDHKLVLKSRNQFEDKYDNRYFESAIERQTPYAGASLMAGHRRGYGTFPAYDGKYRTSGAGEIFAGITLPILRNRSTDESRTNLKIKQLEQKQSEFELRSKKMIYLHKTLSLYYKWVLENKKLQINKSIFELAKLRQEMLEKKFKAGDIEAIKVVDNNRALDKRQGEIIKNEIELNKIKAELGIYLRNKDGSPLELSPEIAENYFLNKANNLSLVLDLKLNPQFNILEIENDKLNTELALYDQSRLPGLNLELLGSREISANYPYDPDQLQLGVKFDFPLENRKAEGKNVAYQYKVRAIKKNRENLEREISQQFHFFLKASQDSKLRWDVTSNEFEKAKLVADAEKKRWANGASDLFVVNLREQDVADVEIRRWTALYDHHQYYLDARLFSGKILPD